jgi:acetyl esterase/lipase
VSGALVVVHGGGWLDCANRKDDVALYAQIVAQVLGVPTFNVEYRLAQEGGGYPENVSDVKCGVQWLRAHAAENGIDPDRIGIMGTSAGAHLALMVALTENRDDLDPHCFDESAEVSLTLSYAGPTDLPTFVSSPSIAKDAPLYYTAEDCATPVEGCSAGRGCTRCVDASPLAQACAADDDPILLMQAPDPYDKFVPQAQAEVLAAALLEAGADVTLVIPTDEAMRAGGCTPEGGSHAVDACMLEASQAIVNPLLIEHLGTR